MHHVNESHTPTATEAYCICLVGVCTKAQHTVCMHRHEKTRTQKDRDFLRAMPDPQTTAETLAMRATRDFGGTPTEAVRRMLDVEMVKQAKAAK